MHEEFMEHAIRLSLEKMREGHGGPFGCVVVKDGKILSEGWNSVLAKNDPTAHAEMEAIRKACDALGNFQLTGCTIYASCEPCPMCLGAIYWARPDAVYFAAARNDAAEAGFDDSFIYDEIPLPVEKRKLAMIPLMRSEACEVFTEWKKNPDKTLY